ncbi:hypothetical protein BU16DRAFT_531128 [Lophium mytilinum]|uniref:Uncharacterized protein n=1 Tax=Lophium mytilinum TaxID=390894 RepID=A0A6A6QAV1_9PEZI|nr:hypothetical protein BU16DRAFT_531128 [Lophium mytilinum]
MERTRHTSPDDDVLLFDVEIRDSYEAKFADHQKLIQDKLAASQRLRSLRPNRAEIDAGLAEISSRDTSERLSKVMKVLQDFPGPWEPKRRKAADTTADTDEVMFDVGGEQVPLGEELHQQLAQASPTASRDQSPTKAGGKSQKKKEWPTLVPYNASSPDLLVPEGFQLMLLVKGDLETGEMRRFEELPDDTQLALLSILQPSFHAEGYSIFFKSDPKDVCLYRRMFTRMKASKWQKDDHDAVCENCIYARRPCVRLVSEGEKTKKGYATGGKLVFTPLLPKYRPGVERWEREEYWCLKEHISATRSSGF